jgi:2-hydroxychromene-2-carboxylate isomerase
VAPFHSLFSIGRCVAMRMMWAAAIDSENDLNRNVLRAASPQNVPAGKPAVVMDCPQRNGLNAQYALQKS